MSMAQLMEDGFDDGGGEVKHEPLAPRPFDPLVALAYTAVQLYRAVCVGNPCPAVADLHRWMKSPPIGSLVVEMSSRRRPNWPQDCVGVLEEITDDGYEATWSIRLYDGRIMNWSNADFIRIPSGDASAREIFDRMVALAEPLA